LFYTPFDEEQEGLSKYVSTVIKRSLGTRVQNLKILKRFSEYHCQKEFKNPGNTGKLFDALFLSFFAPTVTFLEATDATTKKTQSLRVFFLKTALRAVLLVGGITR